MDEDIEKPRVVMSSYLYRVVLVPAQGRLVVEERDEAAMGEVQWKHKGQFYMQPGGYANQEEGRLHRIGQIVTELLASGTIREKELAAELDNREDIIVNLRENLDMHSEQSHSFNAQLTATTREFARFVERVREWDAALVDSILAEFKIEDEAKMAEIANEIPF